MPGGRLRSQLLITSRCLGWCGERGSERGSLPLNNLELNWMSHFLNQRTTAGFNSFSARKPAGSPSSRHGLCCLPPRVRVRVRDRPSGTRRAQLPRFVTAPHSKGETPTHPHPSPAARTPPKPPSAAAAPPRVGSPRRGGEGVLALRFAFSRRCFSLFSQRNSVCRNARQC